MPGCRISYEPVQILVIPGIFHYVSREGFNAYMKYLLITLEYPPQVGGVATYLEELVKSREDQTRVLVLGKNDFFNFLWPKWVKSLFIILREVKSFKPDFIEVSHVLPVGYIALMIKFFKRVTYIVYVHGLDVNMVIKGGNFLKKILLRIVLVQAYKIICNSEFTKSLLGGFNLKNHAVEVLYPQIEKLREDEKKGIIIRAEAKRKELGLENKKVLVSVGRLIRRKGFDAVIKCLAYLGDEYYYIVAGDGPKREELELLAQEQGTGDRVIFAGRVENPYIYIALADVFIMPNQELDNGDVEGFGMVFLEADMFDKPVIGGNSGGAPEAIKMVKRGVVVDAQNIEEIVAAIKKFA